MSKQQVSYDQILSSFPGAMEMRGNIKVELKKYLDYYGDQDFDKARKHAEQFFELCLSYCLDQGFYQDAVYFINMGINLKPDTKNPDYNFLDKFLEITGEMKTLVDLQDSVDVLQFLVDQNLITVNNCTMEAKEKILEYLMLTVPGLEVLDRMAVMEIISDAGLTMYPEVLYDKIKEDDNYFKSMLFVTQRDVQDERIEYIKVLFEWTDGTRDDQCFYATLLVNDLREYLKENPDMILPDDGYMDDKEYARYTYVDDDEYDDDEYDDDEYDEDADENDDENGWGRKI